MFDEDEYDEFDDFDKYIIQKLDTFMDCAKSYYRNQSNVHKKIEDSLKLNILMHTFTDDDVLEIYYMFNSTIAPKFDKITAHKIGFERYANASDLPDDILFCYATLFDEITTRIVGYIDELSERISIDEDDSMYMLTEDNIYKTNIMHIIDNLDHDSLVYLDYIADEVVTDNERNLSPETIRIYEMTQQLIDTKLDSFTQRTPSYVSEDARLP